MLDKAKRIVIKVGSSLLIDANNLHRHEWLEQLAEDILALVRQKKEVLIVTSGAVALGRHLMGLGAKALTLEEKQAAAACGQVPLFNGWANAFKFGGTERMADWLYAAQILLTADDSINRRRYLNARNTLEALLARPSIIPIINENDTVATAELRFGDNDRLAARVAQMASADLLVLLSDIDGLYTNDPRTDKNATRLEEVHAITPDIEAMAGGAGSSHGTGGMATKIAAAKIALAAGCHMIIAPGLEKRPLWALQSGGPCTRFIAAETPLSARKNWIAGSATSGRLAVDAGAAEALANGKSLLPAGVSAVEGVFERGDAVLIVDAAGRTIGKGLTAYSSADAKAIRGRQSGEVEAILGFKGRAAIIHRDDMVME